MLVVGAISQHSALITRDADWMELAKKPSEHVYSDGGICLHPNAKSRKYLQKILQIFNPEEKVIV